MKVLVYPHSMEMGGSQLNALQVAQAVQRRGHEVVVMSEPGPLAIRLAAMGLEHIQIPPDRSRPSPMVMRLLGDEVRRRGIEVVHGHEWPPIIDAYFGAGVRKRAAVVGTVMSMSVVPFLPRQLPLTVGTEKIREATVAAGYQRVALLEPPVDTETDDPLLDAGQFRLAHGIAPDEILVVMVCRIVPDLKLEGLLSACRAVHELAGVGETVRLMIVGDGPARGQLAAYAGKVNAASGRTLIVLPGEMADPRPCYAAADIIIGQGGSALRGMAFAKPLVVIGEDGFSELLTPDSAATFLRQGWYGLGSGSRGTGTPALMAALQPLLASPALRSQLGLFGRGLVERRFGLAAAAKKIEEIYASALGCYPRTRQHVIEIARCGSQLLGYKLQRKYQRWVGTAAIDDANARARIAAILSSKLESNAAPESRTA